MDDLIYENSLSLSLSLSLLTLYTSEVAANSSGLSTPLSTNRAPSLEQVESLATTGSILDSVDEFASGLTTDSSGRITRLRVKGKIWDVVRIGQSVALKGEDGDFLTIRAELNAQGEATGRFALFEGDGVGFLAISPNVPGVPVAAKQFQALVAEFGGVESSSLPAVASGSGNFSSYRAPSELAKALKCPDKALECDAQRQMESEACQGAWEEANIYIAGGAAVLTTLYGPVAGVLYATAAMKSNLDNRTRCQARAWQNWSTCMSSC